MNNPFNLEIIAAQLEGLEETIIYKLMDRAQFHHNPLVYEAGKSGFPLASNESLFSIRLRFQEEIDARFGRFAVPEERPFNGNLPSAERSVLPGENIFPIRDFEIVNQTAGILLSYYPLMECLCRDGDDGQYGSSVEHDVYALQAIARRIHFGALYVAESKFSASPETYAPLIRDNRQDDIMASLTRPEVEERILRRVADKVDYIQKTVNTAVRWIINPEVVLDYYKNTVIPLTKKGELAYLLKRPLDGPISGK